VVFCFFCCTRFRVYGLLRRGWSSNSNYAILGAVRGVAQAISYEVSLAFFFLRLVCLTGSYNFFIFHENQEYIYYVFLIFPVFLMWVLTRLAETNRTPFDFAEGESELVSGFNVVYGRGGFAILFLAEYARIIFIRYLIVMIFLGGLKNVYLINSLGVFFCFVFIWIRGTYPRLRYDKLMTLAWQSLLPSSLGFFMFYFFVNLGVVW